ncbi:hypothetical protein X975_24977, partial [Stegodyphus mimosarum]
MTLCLGHSSFNIRIIDSLNFLRMALSKLPEYFGLSELKKEYLPHLLNSPENQNYVGLLPEAHYYTSNSMRTSTRQALFSWHQEHKEDGIDFQEEMLPYYMYICFLLLTSFLFFLFLISNIFIYILLYRMWIFFAPSAWSLEPSFWML